MIAAVSIGVLVLAIGLSAIALVLARGFRMLGRGGDRDTYK